MRVGPIDLDLTLGCGQVFRWRKQGDRWNGVVGHSEVSLRQNGEGIEPEGDVEEGTLLRFLRADDDVSEMIEEISRDEQVRQMVLLLPGLRLVRQDPWECAASYILATNANIPRIQKMIENVCIAFGDVLPGGRFSFPSPEQIVSRHDAARTCGLGFRCDRFVEFARLVDSGQVDFEALRRMRYEECVSTLKGFPGIGDKVADCISVFSLDHLDAFPVDVRMKRAMLEMYGVSGSYKKVNQFGRERFGRFAGYAQEFIYHSHRFR